MTRTLTLLAALMLGSTAVAQEFTLGALRIDHPHVPVPFAGAKSAAGYMSIENTGTGADRLIGAIAGFADVTMLHLSQTNADGVATMSHVPALEIPAGGTVVLETGGFHVMFMGLTQPLAEGDLLPVVLRFETAGEIEVEFRVDPRDNAGHGTSPQGGIDGHAHGG